MDNDEPFNLGRCNVYLRIAKADGAQFQGNECCTIDNSSIIVDTSAGNGSQILTAPGINKCELHIEDENGIGITTWNFNIYVEARVHNGENISSINSYDVLDNMVNMEKDRIESEQLRKDNEIIRVKNEDQRILEETERQKNESERKKTFGDVLDTARSYASTASVCAFNAKKSEKTSVDNAVKSESWAHGGTGTREGEDSDNAKKYKEQAEEAYENLKNSNVTGVKGNSEATYRTGNVNLTAENIGALPLKGGTLSGDLTINKKLKVHGNVGGLPTEDLRVTPGRVDMIRTSTDDGGNGIPLATFEGTNELDGIIKFYGDRFKINSSNLDIDCFNSINCNEGRFTASYFEFKFDNNFSVWKEYQTRLAMDNHSIFLGGNKSSITINSELENVSNSSKINIFSTDNIDVTSKKNINIRSSNNLKMNCNYLQLKNDGEVNYFEGYSYTESYGKRVVTKIRGGSVIDDATSSVKLYNISSSSYIDAFADQYHFYDKDNNDIFNIRIDGIKVNGNINFVNGDINHNNEILLQNNGDLRLKWPGLYDGFLSGLTAPLYGGTLNRDFNIVEGKSIGGMMADNDYWRIMGTRTGSNAGYLEIATADDATEPIYVSQYSGVFAKKVRTLTLLDEDGNTRIQGDIIVRDCSIRNGDITLDFRGDTFIMNTTEMGVMLNPYPRQFAPYYTWDGQLSLGASSNKWKELYATNGTIQTSDRNEKNTIKELSTEQAQSLIYGLIPSTYQMNAGTSGRTHWGIISQDIEELLEELGMTSLDFAGFIKSPKTERVEIIDEQQKAEKGDEYRPKYEERVIEGEYNYSLRYDEFIAPMIKVIQSQHEEIETLKQKTEHLEQQVQNLLNTRVESI